MIKLFEQERLRDKLAKLNDLEGLKKTYMIHEGGLEDLNTEKFWSDKIGENYGNDLLQSPIYRHKIKTISKILLKQKGTLLDVGFGSGQMERVLGNNHSKLSLYGIDISHTAVKKLRKEINGKFIVGDVYKLPYKPTFFDFVLALDILEHLPPNNVFLAYKEIYRILKKNGIFILSIPLNEGLESLVMSGKNPNGHLRTYTPSIIEAELQINGFKVVSRHYYYAFRRFYGIKTFVVKNFCPNFRDPNLMIIIAVKK